MEHAAVETRKIGLHDASDGGLAGKLGALAVFWVAILLVQQFNWDLGVYKALVLLAVLVTIPGLLALVRRGWTGTPFPSRGLAVGVIFLVVAQAAYCAVRAVHPHLIDIATIQVAADNALLRGQNPYTLSLDPTSGFLTDKAFFGYKHLPMMMAIFFPLGVPFEQRGILITNLLLQLGVVWMMVRLGREIGSAAAGWLAALLYLSLPLVVLQLYAKGSTDLAAVAPLLLALLLLERRPGLAGLCVGLSIAVKLLPGVLFVPCLLPAAWAMRRRYALGIAVGMLPIVPFVLWSPTAFLDNVILWNMLRLPDTTNWVAYAPAGVALFAKAVLIALLLGAGLYVFLRPPTLATRCGLGAMLGLATILCGPAAHHNYQLWWLPFYCVLLAVAVAGAAKTAASQAV